MPTYEYKCLECSYTFEKFQSMKDEPLKVCPKCGGEVKRLIGAGAGAIFKGSGFYQTDYKNSSKPVDKRVTDKTTTKEKAPASSKSDNKNNK